MERELAKQILEETKNDFNRIAPDFSRTRSRFWPELVTVFQGFAKDGNKILDIGCGNGRLLDLYAGKGVDYTGIDNSFAQIEEAKKRCPNNSFLVADALKLPFADKSFDKTFSVAVLHEIPSLEFRKAFLKEARRVLKDEGLLFLTAWDLRGRIGLILKYSFLKIIKRSGLDWGDIFIPWGSEVQRYYHVFGKREISRLVKSSGFEIIKTGVARKQDRSMANLYLIAKKQ
ncbi:MAG: methyltransferase domain-containing protein [bacterium]|nr:methyltransferase domain-containing protein [bacterium]